MKFAQPVSMVLLVLAASLAAAPGVTVKPLNVPTHGKPGFHRLNARDVGLVPRARFQPIQNEMHRETANSGLAAGDVDGDGRIDLFVCGMESPNTLYRNLGNWKFEDITAQAGVDCASWRLSGAVFADVDGDSDLDLITTSLRNGRNFLFLNDGKGKFTESLKIGWVNDPRGGSVGACLADVDGDGDLDMYVSKHLKMYLHQELGVERHEAIRSMGSRPRTEAEHKLYTKYFTYLIKTDAEGKPSRRDVPKNIADQFYLNDGQGGFRAATDADLRFRDAQGRPVPIPTDPCQEAIFRDVDGDGDPDLYVCSDFDWPDRFWINDGSGRFQAIGNEALRRTSQFSMGIDFTDINRDGHVDFLTCDMLSRSHKRRKTQMGQMQPSTPTIGEIFDRPQIMQNTLQLNRGDGTWTEIAQFAGVKASEWSWGVAFTDVDLDGFEDLIVATGMNRDFMDADTNKRADDVRRKKSNVDSRLFTFEWYPKLPTQNVIYRNNGDLTFEYKSDEWGFAKETISNGKKSYKKYKAVSGGLTQADFDGDGDLDLIFNNEDKPLEIYRNETIAPRVAVRLIGHAPNTQAIGAKVRLIGGPGDANGRAPIEQEISCGGGFASGSDTLASFGTGQMTEGLKLEIIWRNRSQLTRTVIENVKPNHLYTLSQSSGVPYFPRPPAKVKPLFEVQPDAFVKRLEDNPAQLLRHTHGEMPFDDFAYQSLLPNRLSQLGPGLAWSDLNGDGREDLAIGSGRSGGLNVFYNRPDNQFDLYDGPPVEFDQAGIVSWTPKPGTRALLIGSANYEAGPKAFMRPPTMIGLDPARDYTAAHNVPGRKSTTGPMAAADVDGDGDLDIFIGGRTVPMRYPEPADSLLLLNDNGTLKPDPANTKVLENLGLISGAVFGDLDADGDPDLILACEWGPIKILRNDEGKFTDATKTLGLDGFKGWWNSVTLGDFDGDGRLDLAAGNWGRNSKYEGSYSSTDPLRIAYGDFDKNGVVDIVEYHRDKLTGKLVPERGRSCSMNAMPFIGERNENFDAFGSGDLEKVYGQCLKAGTVVEATTLSHTVFLNRGGKFVARPLPIEAQFAPVFGINPADFDGDGNEDLFVAQNFFASQRETPRSDGGRGLILRGDGKGGFTSMPATHSGIRIYGEQRGSAVGDYNQDGRPDLAVAQNGSHTRLFRNAEGRPGLRVRLNAGPANPTGVGAIVRLIFANDKKGPAKIVTAGSGYWSQDSAVLILTRPSTASAPSEIEVQWPHGKTTTTKIPTGAAEIEVTSKGKIKKVN
jgi:hypothetical protein